jgi:hypothetical protein
MTTTTVWAIAGSVAACPALPAGVLAEAFCPADAGAVAGPDPELADVCGAADPHAARASAAAARTAADLTNGHRFVRSTGRTRSTGSTPSAVWPQVRTVAVKRGIKPPVPLAMDRGDCPENTVATMARGLPRARLAPPCHTVRPRTPGRLAARCGLPPADSDDARENSWNT